MMILQAFQNPGLFVALISALVVGLTVHEYAHARSAFMLGDLTAYMRGRLTLDPRKHIDPIGALVFLVVGFGWAKPVPIDPYRLGPRGTVLVSLAGPASNVAMAALAGLPLQLGLVPLGGFVGSFLGFFAFLNILLAVFNMIPVAPLDGWKVLIGLLPPRPAAKLQQYEQYGMIALLVLVFLADGVLWRILSLFGHPLLYLTAGEAVADSFFRFAG